MKNLIHHTVTLIVALFVLSPMVVGSSITMSFQGILTDIAGNTVPDSTYQVVFSIYDDSVGGNELWREVHPAVATSNGLFGVILGSITPLDQSVFSFLPRWLEIAVGADPPISPRTRLTEVPSAASSLQLNGIVQTGPGTIAVYPPDPFSPEDTSPHIVFIADSLSTKFFLQPPDPFNPPLGGLEGGVFPVESFFDLMYTIGLADSMLIKLKADSLKAALTLKHIPGNGSHGSEVEIASTLDSGAVIRMFVPQTGVPPDPFLELKSGIGGGASINIYNPQMARGGTASSDTLVQITGDSVTGGRVVIRNPTNGFSSVRTGQSLSFNSAAGGTTALINGNGDSYLINSKLGLGTNTPGNILTVVQGSSTDPIADAWTTYSSRRWKKNIKPIKNALEKVMKLRGVSFDWKADGKHDIGLIAEEVGEVIPEVVIYEANGVDARSVDYARLVAVLIEAVKEQQLTITRLQRQADAVEALRTQVNRLQEQMQTILSRLNSDKSGTNKLAVRQ